MNECGIKGGRFIALVGVAPVKPVESVNIRVTM